MARIFSKLLDFLWAGVAAVLIASAVLVTVVRLLLPEVGSQREAVAAWIGGAVGRPAVIGAISASWGGWSPRIEVADITILDPSESEELIRFERATVTIAPLRSLLSGSLKPRSLVVSGVELTLLRDAEGNFSVAGMPPPKSPVVRWLMRQDNFAVTEADLTIIDAGAGQSFALSDLTLTIGRRAGNKHVTAFLDLPPSIGSRLVVELDAAGDPLGSDWDGAINFRVDGANSDYLVDQLEWHGAR
ncbi:MAG: YhdP family protein, partial [Gammaproteobacteria bacterium]